MCERITSRIEINLNPSSSGIIFFPSVMRVSFNLKINGLEKYYWR